jgi:hypothetical protein
MLGLGGRQKCQWPATPGKKKVEMFQLMSGGVGVMPDPSDNAALHDVPHHDSGTRISFEVVNVGDVGGNAKVSVELDDIFAADWQSSLLDPGQHEAGFVSLGRLEAGDHSALVFVNPGSGQSDHETNQFNVA